MDKGSQARCSCRGGRTEPVDWEGWWSQLEGEGERGMVGRSGCGGRAEALPTVRRRWSTRAWEALALKTRLRMKIQDEYLYWYPWYRASSILRMRHPLISTPMTRYAR